MVLESVEEKKPLQVTGWLQRQRLLTGDPTTLTWKAHREWFTTRRARAVVWLMRRAKRAFKLAVRNHEALVVIRRAAARARAVTYLIEVGYLALQSQEKRYAAQRHLLQRCVQAQRVRTKMDEAFVFLKQSVLLYGEIIFNYTPSRLVRFIALFYI